MLYRITTGNKVFYMNTDPRGFYKTDTLTFLFNMRKYHLNQVKLIDTIMEGIGQKPHKYEEYDMDAHFYEVVID
jgi:hypothetical protein